MFLINQPFW